MINLTDNQTFFIRGMYRKFDKEIITKAMDNWLDSLDNNLYISVGNKSGNFNIGLKFPGHGRKAIYDAIVNFEQSGTLVTVSIPSGDGFYITVCRSGSGNLVISDKRYQSYNIIKRHNRQVPGGLTFEELSRSPIRWVLEFAEVVND